MLSLVSFWNHKHHPCPARRHSPFYLSQGAAAGLPYHTESHLPAEIGPWPTRRRSSCATDWKTMENCLARRNIWFRSDPIPKRSQTAQGRTASLRRVLSIGFTLWYHPPWHEQIEGWSGVDFAWGIAIEAYWIILKLFCYASNPETSVQRAVVAPVVSSLGLAVFWWVPKLSIQKSASHYKSPEKLLDHIHIIHPFPRLYTTDFKSRSCHTLFL